MMTPPNETPGQARFAKNMRLKWLEMSIKAERNKRESIRIQSKII